MLLCYDGQIKGFSPRKDKDNLIIECERDKYGMRLEEFESINFVKSKGVSEKDQFEIFHVVTLSYFRVNHQTPLTANLRVLTLKFSKEDGQLLEHSQVSKFDLTHLRIGRVKCLQLWESEGESPTSSALNIVMLSMENKS